MLKMNVLISDPIDSKAINLLKNEGLKVVYQPQIPAPELINIIPEFNVLLVRSRTKVTSELINTGKKLSVIGRIGSGYDNINLASAKKRSITVINAPHANSQSVAELTICLMIALLRDLPKVFTSMRAGQWLKNEIWGGELSGKTVGVLGYGFVGRKVVALLRAFGCRVLIYSSKKKSSSLEEIFKRSDLISIHLSLNKETEGLVSKKLLNIMKKTAYLVNISRGKIVDEKALYEVLKSGKIAGAALDVFWQEPLAPDSKWRKLENILLTPHIGAATNDALKKASLTVASDVIRIAGGENPRFKVI